MSLNYFYPSLLLSSLLSCSVYASTPTPITSCTDLQNIAQNMAGDYVLTQDIDCTNVAFYPIQNAQTDVFTGTLNGQNLATGEAYIVHNLSIQPIANLPTGLFVGIGDGNTTAQVANIHFEQARVLGAHNQNSGLIAGYTHGVELDNISVNGLNVFSQGTGDSHAVGGIVGYAEKTRVSHVRLYAPGENNMISISSTSPAGGLIGVANKGTRIYDSSASDLKPGSIICGVNTCAFGGLVGAVMDTLLDAHKIIISRSFALGKIKANKNAGGLIGLIEPNTFVDIDNSYAIVELEKANVYGRYAGGLIGQAKESSNFTKGNIQLVNVYAAGKVGSFEHARGIVGNGDKSSTRVKSVRSFFDQDATDRKYPGDKYTDPRDNKVYISLDLTTDKMKFAQTFRNAGWDETVWTLTDTDYPRLK